jgi:hypothetical protein
LQDTPLSFRQGVAVAPEPSVSEFSFVHDFISLPQRVLKKCPTVRWRRKNLPLSAALSKIADTVLHPAASLPEWLVRPAALYPIEEIPVLQVVGP